MNAISGIPQNSIDNLRDLLASNESTIHWLFSILNSVNTGILIVDDSLIVRYINPGYTQITGVTQDQIIGRLLVEVRPGAMLPEVVRTGKPMSGLIRQEKEVEYVVDLAPIILDNKIKGGIGVFKDITQIRRLSKELERIAKQKDRLKSMVQHAYKAAYTFNDIIGSSESIQKVIHFAKRFALSRHDILITGESGTGKEVLAHAIHSASDRPAEPFITINCAALPPTLLESELFGYADGAFTGAKKGGKVGLFEIADGGTIFLDEIAEMTIEMQSRFLRVLQEKTIRRIGATQQTPLDVRVITATNKDLNAMVEGKLFRHDLYFRLSVLNIHMPPLRERLEDIWVLADHFLEYSNKKLKRQIEFDPMVYERFSKYSWPGNVRELIHAVQFASQVVEDSVIMVHHLPKSLNPESMPEWLQKGTLSEAVKDLERKVIAARLNYFGTSVKGMNSIAHDLGISKATLYNKIKGLGIRSKNSKNLDIDPKILKI